MASRARWPTISNNGTNRSGDPCAPEDDYTTAPGTHCFITGQAQAGASIGDADIDGGETTLISPTFDITNIIEPQVTYYRWFTNNIGDSPDSDEWVVQVSADGGGTWVDLERTTDSAARWEMRSFLLADYIVPSSDVI